MFSCVIIKAYLINQNIKVFMFKNCFVLAPIASKELCIALHCQSNGLYVIPCSKIERFLNKYKEELQCGFKQDKSQKFKSNLWHFLRYKAVWTSLDGVLPSNSANTLRYPVVFEATNKNMAALNVLHNNIYPNPNLPIKQMIKQYPLIALYLTISHEIWR